MFLFRTKKKRCAKRSVQSRFEQLCVYQFFFFYVSVRNGVDHCTFMFCRLGWLAQVAYPAGRKGIGINLLANLDFGSLQLHFHRRSRVMGYRKANLNLPTRG